MGLFIVGEGHGEEDALPSLVHRVSEHLGLDLPYNATKHNWRKPLVTETHVRAACELARAFPRCEALLLTRDADLKDLQFADCPKFTAPVMGGWVRRLTLPFPVAVVLFYKEYETLFLAGAGGFAGQAVKNRRGETIAAVRPDAVAHPSPEHPLHPKAWVGTNLITGYKPTVFQASLTRLLDLDLMEASGLSSYRRFVSALRFLSTNRGVVGAVYPPGPGVGADA